MDVFSLPRSNASNWTTALDSPVVPVQDNIREWIIPLSVLVIADNPIVLPSGPLEVFKARIIQGSSYGENRFTGK